MPRTASVLTALALSACGTTFSNDPWQEDADFLNALPGPDQFDLTLPGSLALADCEDPDASTLACLTVTSVEHAVGLTTVVADLTDVIRGQTPTERGEDHRVWGPGDWVAELPGTFVRVEMSRSPTRSTYAWAYQLSESSQGPWSGELLSGTHQAGTELVAAGSGDLVFDQEAFAEHVGTGGSGVVTIAYDVRDGIWLQVETAGSGRTEPGQGDGTWTYEALPDGGGEFSYDSAFDLTGGSGDEQVDVHVRLTPSGEGRGDALASGGTLTGGLSTASECWDPDGQLTWHTDDFGWQEQQGDEQSCAFADAAWPATD